MARRLRASNPKTNATRPKKAEVAVSNIAHPKVWKTALKLAGGDPKRLTVINYSEIAVIVD